MIELRLKKIMPLCWHFKIVISLIEENICKISGYSTYESEVS